MRDVKSSEVAAFATGYLLSKPVENAVVTGVMIPKVEVVIVSSQLLMSSESVPYSQIIIQFTPEPALPDDRYYVATKAFRKSVEPDFGRGFDCVTEYAIPGGALGEGEPVLWIEAAIPNVDNYGVPCALTTGEYFDFTGLIINSAGDYVGYFEILDYMTVGV